MNALFLFVLVYGVGLAIFWLIIYSAVLAALRKDRTESNAASS